MVKAYTVTAYPSPSRTIDIEYNVITRNLFRKPVPARLVVSIVSMVVGQSLFWATVFRSTHLYIIYMHVCAHHVAYVTRREHYTSSTPFAAVNQIKAMSAHNCLIFYVSFSFFLSFSFVFYYAKRVHKFINVKVSVTWLLGSGVLFNIRSVICLTRKCPKFI